MTEKNEYKTLNDKLFELSGEFNLTSEQAIKLRKLFDEARRETCVSCGKRVAMKNNSLCRSCAQELYIGDMIDDHERRIKKLERGA